MRRSLAGPPTAVRAALEQQRCVGDVTTSSPATAGRISVAVGVCITALDAHCRVASGLRLGRTGARSDCIHSLQESATVATTGSIARLQHSQPIMYDNITRHYVSLLDRHAQSTALYFCRDISVFLSYLCMYLLADDGLWKLKALNAPLYTPIKPASTIFLFVS